MHNLMNSEAVELAGLLVRVGRPHSPEDAALLEQWVTRLSLRGGWVLPHDTDLLA
jgi:hypothetical protein